MEAWKVRCSHARSSHNSQVSPLIIISRTAQQDGRSGSRTSSGATSMKPELQERYSRQVLFAPLGEQGQERLLASRVAIVGCGATGSTLASLLARSGVGYLRIIDRDFVEPSNLQRQ